MALTSFRIKVGERWYTVQVGELTGSPVEVIVDGETLYIEVEGLPPPPTPSPRRGRPRSSGASGADAPVPRPRATSASPSDKFLRSPMPGKVISIMVRPGERVSAGDEVCVVEAMKMEQSIRAARDGIIKAVMVQPMDSVSKGDPLIEME